MQKRILLTYNSANETFIHLVKAVSKFDKWMEIK